MVKEITLIANHRANHQWGALQATNIGLSKLNINSIIHPNNKSLPKTKHVAVWGWRKGIYLRQLGYEVLVWERGYIGDRFKYTSVGWNGLNGHATFPEYPDDGGKRFEDHGGVIKPWREGGEYIVILGQVRGDASLQGNDISKWYKSIADQIKAIYDVPVYFRPHPESKRRGGYSSIDGIKNIGGSLEDALSGALFTVAYNSNSCLDSILSGIPCYAGDRGTMAWDYCMKDLNQIVRPDRGDIHKIAWTQWELSEIESGAALRELLK